MDVQIKTGVDFLFCFFVKFGETPYVTEHQVCRGDSKEYVAEEKRRQKWS